MVEQLKSIIGICDGFNFVLPANMVAEIVSGVSVTTTTDPQPWQAGQLSWNGLDVPVLSIEQLVIGRRPRLRGSHVAVIRGTSNTEVLPFYGIPVQTMPHDHRLLASMEIVKAPIPDEFNMVDMIARIRGVNCIVPDIEALENQIINELNVAA